MNGFTRRKFLLASGTAAVALGVGGVVTWDALSRRAEATPMPQGTPILVIVSLYGGNDGINTVIPYTDPAYHAARPDFAYDPGVVLHLDAQLGLNPSMPGFAKLWQNKQLAVVRGVGYPQPDHSHFRSMDIWQTASPATPINTGWIGRWLDATGDDPIRAVNIGSVLPPLAVGAKSAAAALIPGRDTTFPPDIAAVITALGGSDPTDTPPQITVAQSYCSERTVTRTFSPVLDPTAPTDGTGDHSPAGSGGAHNALDAQLQLVSRCIKAGVPTRVYTASLGGFDTHAAEKATQERQLAQFDSAVATFLTGLSGDPRAADVVLMAYTEFGRRVHANASDGTDHGTAGPVFLAGPGVAGGFYGEQPSLTDLDDGDLKSNVDFRSIYAELLSKTLGADPTKILGGSFAPVGALV